MSWEVKKLEEVCDFIMGQAPPSSSYNYDGKGDLFLSVRDFGPLYPSTTRYTTQPLKFSKLGDVLMCVVGATCGKINLGIDAVITRSIFALRPKPIILQKYLYYFLNSIYDKLNNIQSGAAQGVLNQKILGGIYVPTPPLSIQKQIIAILDKSLENIAKAKENTGNNLQNAKEVFESYLQSVFENKGEGWEEKRIEELDDKKNAIVSGPFGSNLKVKDYKSEGIPIIRLQNIGKGYFINKDIKYISIQKADELKYHSFASGDIVLAKLGIPIGKTCTIPSDFKRGIIVADVVRIRLDKRIVNYNFLEYYLNTHHAISQLNKNVSGATRPRVNLSDVRNIKINLPPLSIQAKMVLKFNGLAEETKKLSEIYTQKLSSLEELKQSILQKAFNGELTEVSA